METKTIQIDISASQEMSETLHKHQVSISTLLLLFTSSASLLLGGSIYIFLRVTPTWLEVLLLNMTGIDTKLFISSLNLSENLVKLLNNHGADFFWMVSLSLGFSYFFSHSSSFGAKKYVGLFALTSLSIFLELAQYLGFLPGTFDIYDIVAFILAIAFANCLIFFFYQVEIKDGISNS